MVKERDFNFNNFWEELGMLVNQPQEKPKKYVVVVSNENGSFVYVFSEIYDSIIEAEEAVKNDFIDYEERYFIAELKYEIVKTTKKKEI